MNLSPTVDRLDILGDNAILLAVGRTLDVGTNLRIGTFGGNQLQTLKISSTSITGASISNFGVFEVGSGSTVDALSGDGLLLLRGDSTYGNSSLNLNSSTNYEGETRFTSVGAAWGSTLTMTGSSVFDNSGTMNFETGDGGARSFKGGLFNRGFINIGQPTTFSTGPITLDQNKLHVLATNKLTVSNGVTFTMDGGQLEVDGDFEQSNGTFQWNTGDILNRAPVLGNNALELGPSNLSPGSIRIRGTSSSVSGILRGNQSLTLFGDSVFGASNTSWLGTGDLPHQGQTTLTSEGAVWTTTITVPTGARFLNQGTVVTTEGTGGARNINGDFRNDTGGSVVFSTPTTMSIGPIENDGSWLVDNGASMNVANNVNFVQTGGTIDVTAGSFSQNNGSMLLNDGVFAGIPSLGAMSLTLGPAFTSNFEAQLRGASNLTGDIESGQILNILGDSVRGAATLSLNQATTNAGLLRLDSEGSTWTSRIQDGGNGLSNTGTVEFNPGTGGLRYLRSNFTNDGLVSVNTPTVLETGSYINRGNWNVDASASIQVNNSLTFTQESGTVQADGSWTQANGTLNLIGGAFNGDPLLSTMSLNMDPAFVSPFTARIRGASTLQGDVKTDQSLTILGDNTFGTATLNLASASTISGDVELTSTGGTFQTRLGTTNQPLTITGTVQSSPGSGGTRFIRGDIDNQGQLLIDSNTTFEDGPVLNSGDIEIASGSAAALNNSMTFEQSAGTLQIDGALTQANGTVRLLGGDVLGVPLYSTIALELGAGFTSAFESRIRGASTLTGDIEAGQKLSVLGDNFFGAATFNLAGPTMNAGEIEMTSESGIFTVNLGTNGIALDNQGSILVEPGSGGGRTIRGELNNSGSLVVNQPLTMQNGPIVTSGDIMIASGQRMGLSNSMEFDITGGTIQVDGEFEQPNGTARFLGGEITGNPLFSASTLFMEPGFDQAFTGTMRGNSTLNGELQADQQWTVRGDNFFGTATLNLPAPSTNRGTLEFTSEGGGFTTTLNATLGNEVINEGVIRTLPGSGGARTLNMQLENDGLFEVLHPTTLPLANADHSNRGLVRAEAPLTVRGSSFTNVDGARFESASSVTNDFYAIQNDGDWVVGPGIGTNNLSGDWNQSATGRLVIEIGGPSAGVDHDQMVIAGTATLDGRVRLKAANGYQPQFGDQFIILDAGSIVGRFNGASYDGDLPLGYRFTLVKAGDLIVAQVVQGIREAGVDEVPLTVLDPVPGLAGQLNTFQVSGASGDGQVVLVFGTALGSTPTGACSGVDFGIDAAQQIGTAFASYDGHALLSGNVPAGASGITAYFQAVDLERCEISDVTSFLFP